MNRETTKNWIQLVPGVRRKTVAVGDNMMQVMVFFEAGAKVPEHAHVHEQITTIVSGRMRFTVAGQPQELSQGNAIALHSNVPHAAEAVEDSLLLDTFNPRREDLLKADAEHAKKSA
ncbi:MAG TPA: cupin domain-containing protein [Tepidisphaeraceae bacterium]